MKLKLALLFGAAALLLAGGARSSSAGVILTPIIFLGGGSQLVCVANSISPQSVAVAVTIVGNTSNGSSNCTVSSANRDGCQAFLTGQSGHCRISVASLSDAEVQARFRGVLFSRITVSPFTVFTTVEAR